LFGLLGIDVLEFGVLGVLCVWWFVVVWVVYVGGFDVLGFVRWLCYVVELY